MTNEPTQFETRILVIDDDQVDRRAVRRALGDLYSVVDAANGSEALERLATEPVDCVLLDFDIPGTNTLALVAELSKQVPVVMLTGHGNETIAVALMKAGAQDYLSKDGFSAESLDRSIRMAINKAARRRNLDEARQRMRSEYLREKQRLHKLESSVQIARDIQQNLIPSRSPDLDGFDMAGLYLPAEATGGDFFDYVPMPDGTLGIVVGDVSGHGLGPALVATEIRAHLRALAQTSSDIAQIVTIANHLLWKDTNGDPFATLLFLKLDVPKRTAAHASAGHQAWVVHSSGEPTSFDATALPLGMLQETHVPASPPLPLHSGDILLLMTDGLTETLNPDHRLFGKDRCLSIVREHCREPAEKIIDRLLHAAQSFADGERQHDDITIVVVKVH